MNDEQSVLFWAFLLPMGFMLWGMAIISTVLVIQAAIQWFGKHSAPENLTDDPPPGL